MASNDSSRIAHWSMFGQPGSANPAPTKRTLASDWKTKPFTKPVTAAWSKEASPASPAGGSTGGTAYVAPHQISRLLLGFMPHQMEDKWFVYVEGPDAATGELSAHMHRSWTGYKVVEARAVVKHFATAIPNDSTAAAAAAAATAAATTAAGDEEAAYRAEFVSVTWNVDEEQSQQDMQKMLCDVLRWCMQVDVQFEQ